MPNMLFLLPSNWRRSSDGDCALAFYSRVLFQCQNSLQFGNAVSNLVRDVDVIAVQRRSIRTQSQRFLQHVSVISIVWSFKTNDQKVRGHRKRVP